MENGLPFWCWLTLVVPENNSSSNLPGLFTDERKEHKVPVLPAVLFSYWFNQSFSSLFKLQFKN